MRSLLAALFLLFVSGFYVSSAYQKAGGIAGFARFRPELLSDAWPVGLAFLAPAVLTLASLSVWRMTQQIGWRLPVVASLAAALLLGGVYFQPELRHLLMRG